MIIVATSSNHIHRAFTGRCAILLKPGLNCTEIPKTLAARHQHYMCYQMLESEKYLRHQDTCTGSQCTYIQVQVALFILLTASSISIEDFEFSEEITHSLPELSLDTKLWRLEMLNHKLLL